MGWISSYETKTNSYKVALHNHSTLSDGQYTPAEATQLFSSQGFDAFALTDHDYSITTMPENPGNIGLFIPGCEESVDSPSQTHILNLFGSRTSTIKSSQGLIDDIKSVGGIPCLAHPNHPNWLWTYSALAPLHGIDLSSLMEIYNASTDASYPGSGVATDKWRYMWRTGRRVWGVAVDDFHSAHYNKGYVIVNANSLSTSSIQEALLSGNFYPSSGRSVTWSAVGNSITVTTDSATQIQWFGGQKDTPLRTVSGVTQDTFSPDTGLGFVYAVVGTDVSNMAWTQPIYSDKYQDFIDYFNTAPTKATGISSTSNSSRSLVWNKTWKDGRRETVSLRGDDIDTSDLSFDLILSKLARTLGDDVDILSPGVKLTNPYDLSINYRAFDVKCYLIGGVRYLYMVYGKPETSNVNDTWNYDLFFAKYDLDKDVWVRKNVNISNMSVNKSIFANRKATINRYSDGRLWVCFSHEERVSTHMCKIISCTSTNDGESWSNFRTIKTENLVTEWYEEDFIPKLVLKGNTSNTWKTIANSNASGGTYKRAGSSSSSGKVYAQFKVKCEDVWLYTYTTTKWYDEAKGIRWCGKMKIYIDGKYIDTINLASSSVAKGHQTKIKLNKKKLSDKVHTIKLCHTSGKFFYVDAIAVQKKADIDYFFEDATIRENSIDSKEAIAVIGQKDNKTGYRNLHFYVDRSGTSSQWGEQSVEKSAYSFIKSSKGYRATWDMFASIHENNRGLYLQVQKEDNYKNILSTYIWTGSESRNSKFDNPTWSWLHNRTLEHGGVNQASLLSTKAIRYSISTSYDNNLSLWVTANRGEKSRHKEAEEYTLGYTAAVDLKPIPFSYEGSFLPLQAFNIPYREGDEPTCAILCVNSKGELAIFYSKLETKSIGVEDISDYVDNLEIEHDDTSESSTLSCEINNVDNLLNSRDDFGAFYSLLPSNYDDRDLRLVKVVAKYDQGPFYYETSAFTGILGSVNEKYSRSGHSISFSALDYSKWLRTFQNPGIYVYANPPIEWMETASDYPMLVSDGVSLPRSPRTKNTYKYTDEVTNKEKEVTVGWEISKCRNQGSFKIYPDQGIIKQNGWGELCSPVFPKSTSGSYSTCDFNIRRLPDDSDAYKTFRFCFHLHTFNSTWGQSKNGVKEGGQVIISPRNNGKVELFLTSNYETKGGQSPAYVPFEMDTWYRMTVKCVGRDVVLRIYQRDSNKKLTEMRGTRASTFKDCMAVAIGSQSNTIDLEWDNVSVRKIYRGAGLKQDSDVATQVVGAAFQGIVPFLEGEHKGEYFNAVVWSPEDSASDVLDRLASQTFHQWYFDYSGRFIWDDRALKEPTYYLTDDDMSSMTLSYDPMDFRNWVEVVCPPNDQSSAKYKNNYQRASRADVKSIHKHGLRYLHHEMDLMYTREQADKVALGKFYETHESMEKLDVELVTPKIFIIPRDEVVIDSNSLFPGEVGKYEKAYHVSTVSISCSEGKVVMSLGLVSRRRSRLGIIADSYNNDGIAF